MPSESGKFTYQAKNPIFRFSHQRRLASVSQLVDVRPGDAILDFGGGDGHVVAKIAEDHPEANFVILEPFRTPEIALAAGLPNIKWVRDQSELAEIKFDKITCIDVLEHLPDSVLNGALQFFRERLKDGGTCIISVPIEVGFPALFKNAIRAAFKRPHPGTTLHNVFLSAMGRANRIVRVREGDVLLGHIGFDAFGLIDVTCAKTGFSMSSTYTSPFSTLPWFLNNQLGIVLTAPG